MLAQYQAIPLVESYPMIEGLLPLRTVIRHSREQFVVRHRLQVRPPSASVITVLRSQGIREVTQ